MLFQRIFAWLLERKSIFISLCEDKFKIVQSNSQRPLYCDSLNLQSNKFKRQNVSFEKPVKKKKVMFFVNGFLLLLISLTVVQMFLLLNRHQKAKKSHKIFIPIRFNVCSLFQPNNKKVITFFFIPSQFCLPGIFMSFLSDFYLKFMTNLCYMIRSAVLLLFLL